MANLQKGLGLKLEVDSKYNEYKKLEVDEKSLPFKLPTSLDYSQSKDFPSIDDQGQLGTCVSYACRKFDEFYRDKRLNDFQLTSARAIYAAAKAKFAFGDNTDDGLQCSWGLDVLQNYYVNESDWPSVPNDSEKYFVNYLEVAPSNLHKTNILVKQYVTVAPDIMSMKKASYAKGLILIGLAWANEWFNPDTNGVLPIPQSVAGGHCVLIPGWNDNIQCPDGTFGAFRVANNWSDTWADKGFCWLPYSYVNIQNGQFWPTNLFTAIVP